MNFFSLRVWYLNEIIWWLSLISLFFVSSLSEVVVDVDVVDGDVVDDVDGLDAETNLPYFKFAELIGEDEAWLGSGLRWGPENRKIENVFTNLKHL